MHGGGEVLQDHQVRSQDTGRVRRRSQVQGGRHRGPGRLLFVDFERVNA